LLRGSPYHFSQRQSYLPINLLAKHGLSQEELFRGHVVESKQLADVVYEVASIAKHHLDLGRELKSSVPKQAIPALANAAIADDFLIRLQKAHFNVFDASLIQPNIGFPLKLWRNRLFKTY